MRNQIGNKSRSEYFAENAACLAAQTSHIPTAAELQAESREASRKTDLRLGGTFTQRGIIMTPDEISRRR